MPEVVRTVHLLTRRLPEGLWFAEPLHHPEIARLGTLRRVVHREAIRDLQRVAARSDPGEPALCHGGPPAEIRAVVVPLGWSGERELLSRPLEILVPAVLVRHADHEIHAFVPGMDVETFASSLRRIDALLSLEIRRALKRTGADRDLLLLARSLRADELDVEPRRVRLRIPSAVEHRRTREQELAALLGEGPLLPRLAAHLRPRRCREAFGIDALVERVAQEWTSADPACVLLVGPPGTGKTATLHELVRRSATLGLEEREFWETRGSRLAGGAAGFGMLQERCQTLVREAHERRAILLLGSLFELVQVGRAREGTEGAAEFLLPFLVQGRLLAAAECTPEQADALERSHPRLLRAFRRIDVVEPGEAAAREILGRVAGRAERRRAAVIDDSALDAILRLHRRYAGYSALPGKALRFLDGLLAEGGAQSLVGEQEVVAAFAEQSGLPRFLLDDTVRLDPDEVRGRLRAQVLGQDEAVDTLADLVVSVKAGLGRAERPIASLLFAGPTGVGKTETAKALAAFFFASPARMTRFDMSEYADPSAVPRLIGGSASGEGLLTAKVREQPFQVLLLDEIEKADPRLFDLLLQVLGEGRLTDAAGRTADFRNTVLILTSNLGADSYRVGSVGFRPGDDDVNDAREHFERAVREHFRPEFFNRIDRIIPFLPLPPAVLREIADREIARIRCRSGVLDRRLALDIDPGALERILAEGTDPAYGARPLRRALERRLLVPLAHRLANLPWDQPVAAAATPDPNGPGVTVSVRGTGSAAAPPTSLSPLAPLSDVRRRLQRFRDHPLAIRLEDEIVRLARARDALTRPRRGQAVPEALLERVRLLKRMEEALSRLHRFEADLLQIEENALLALIAEQAGPALDRAAAAVPSSRARLRDAILQVLALDYAEPDRAHVILHAESDGALPAMASAIVHLAGEWKGGVSRAWIYVRAGERKSSLAKIRRVDEDPVRLGKGVVPPEAIGAALTVEAPLAFLRLESEAGIHLLKKKGQSRACRISVLPGDQAVPETVPPPPAAGMSPRRREYDFDARRARDFLLDTELLFRRTELGDLLADAIDRAVDRRILELTEP